MAEGIRIRHTDPRRANSVHVVPLLHKPFGPDHTTPCGACLRGAGQELIHPCKTLHLALDDQATIIVARPILEDLRRMPDCAGYRVAEAIANPPTQGISPPRINMRIDGLSFGSVEVTADEYVDGRAKAGVTNDDAINELAAMLIQQMLGIKQGVHVHAHRS